MSNANFIFRTTKQALRLLASLLTEPFRLTGGRLERAPLFFSLIALVAWLIRAIWIQGTDTGYSGAFTPQDFEYRYSLFFFLLWNLFLAWVPFSLARYLHPDQSGWFFWPMLGIWLLFLPNAPYLITDFIHFGTGISTPFWLELLVFGSFSAAGIALGSYALLHVHHCLEIRYDQRVAWAFTPPLLLLTAMGVVIGRTARFNSWDVFVRPLDLLAGLGNILSDPREIAFFLFFSFTCFTFLLLCYLLVYYGRRGRITRRSL